MRLYVLIAMATIAALATSCREVSQQPRSLSDDASPQQVLDHLMQGNHRFVHETPHDHNHEHQKLRKLAHGQKPHAIILTCSDSRIAPEFVFDQGVGELFAIRTAGHVVGKYALGSIEFAVEHLNVRLIVVLGHQDCGAIKACVHNVHEDTHVQDVINRIREEAEEQALLAQKDPEVRHYVEANVRFHVHLLQNSDPVLRPLVQQGKLRVVGAILNEETGVVQLLPPLATRQPS